MATKSGDIVEEKSLGRVQLLTESGERILVPKPSNSPDDPLNWSVIPKVSLYDCSPIQVYTIQILCSHCNLLWHADVHFPRSWPNSCNRSDRNGFWWRTNSKSSSPNP